MAVISIGSGHSVGYLTGEVGQGREGYYTGAVAAGEPPGLWYGAGAEVLGLRGEVDADVMETLYSRMIDPRDPAGACPLAPAHRRYKSADERYAAALAKHPDASPEKRAQLRAAAEKATRQATAFVDLTFSPVKSITITAVAFERMANEARARGELDEAAAWDAYRQHVEDAVMAGARATIDYLEDTAAYARRGNHSGATKHWEDAHTWVVAQFLQHDSREHDPQLHVHQALLNLQQTRSGEWFRLDTVAIGQQHHAAAAIGARVMEAELARTIGARFAARADGFRELVGIPEAVREMFSSRRRAITPRVAKLADAYRAQFGRDPSRLELFQMAQRATLETRKGKSHGGETEAQRLERWERETREKLVGGLGEVARSFLAASPDGAGEPERFDPDRVIERALHAVTAKEGKWLRADLLAAVSDALPANLGMPADTVRGLLEGLTDTALERARRLTPDEVGERAAPAGRRLDDGEIAFRRPGQVYYATPEHLGDEQLWRRAAGERGGPALGADTAQRVIDRYRENGVELGLDQAEAVRGILTDGATVSPLVAAAGAGKSFTVGAVAGAWAASGGRVHGLAPSQVAAEVLAEEGLPSWNTAAWLGAQERGGGGEDGPPMLQPGDLVVVDEAGMTSTPDLAAIVARVRAAGAKMVPVGDERQLAAVGPGGAFADIVAGGRPYRLVEVRRFSAEWERVASLGLRDGNAAVLEAYDRAGRIVDGGTPEQAAAKAASRWLADTLRGRESLLIVPTNEEAARASATLRAQLVELGRVDDEATVELGRDGNRAGAGDVVQARHNAWDLRGWKGNNRVPINRETYRVVAAGDGGELTVEHTRTGARLELPADYVREHLTLSYATTVHGAQGRTVDTAHGIAGRGVDAAALYVQLTRGRDGNWVHVITRPTGDDDASGAALDVEPRAPMAVLGDILERDRRDRTALATAEALGEEARSTATLLERLAVEASAVTAGRAGQLLDAAAATGAITDEMRVKFATDPAMGTLERLLRQAEVAGHDPAAVMARALEGGLDDAVAPAAVVHHRISHTVDLDVSLSSAHELIPRDVDETWRPYLEQLADAADARRVELGQRTAQQAVAADEAAAWAVQALGQVPADPLERAEWEHRAGWAAAHRELVGHDDAADPLGAAPASMLLEKHAMWRTAHEHLGLPDRGPEERQATVGELLCRVVAAERERAWAPRWVGDALAASAERLEDLRATATLLAARAESKADDDPDRAELLAAAAADADEAERLARTVEQLQDAHDARDKFLLHAAPTLEEGERARVELDARGIDPAGERKVSGEEWLAEHRAAMTAEDPHREVTAVDVDDTPDDAGRALAETDEDRDGADDVVETALPDLREIAAADPTEYTDDPAGTRRVPNAAELDAIVERAAVARAELAARAPDDAAHEQHDDTGGPVSMQRWAADHDSDARVWVDS